MRVIQMLEAMALFKELASDSESEDDNKSSDEDLGLNETNPIELLATITASRYLNPHISKIKYRYWLEEGIDNLDEK